MIRLQQTFLNFILFQSIDLWDTKRYTSASIESEYKIVELGDCIREQSKKYKIFEKADESFGILGVNNQSGIFDAYISKGKEINQPYKKMEVGWIAYNPYRINVGSIGIRKRYHNNDYISPAYVVFSCEETLLLPEYLYLLFKSQTFNRIINESTTGSVRQNLSFDILKKLKIPLPSLEEQERIVKAYKERIRNAKSFEKEAEELEKRIEEYLHTELGVNVNNTIENKKGKLLDFINYQEVERWALSHIFKNQLYSFKKTKYNILPIKALLKSFDGGKTPSTSQKEYWQGSVNWFSAKDMKSLKLGKSEDFITTFALDNAGMKLHPEGTVLGVFRSGILRHSFPVAILEEPATINQDLKAMNFNSSLVFNKYALYYMHVFQKMILEQAQKIGVTVESLNTDEFLEVPFVLPPMEIQKTIVNTIEDLKTKIEDLKNMSELLKIEANKEFEEEIFGI